MGMSDCIKCWETPCSCGYGYKHKNDEQMAEFIYDILSYRSLDSKKDILNMISNKLDTNNDK